MTNKNQDMYQNIIILLINILKKPNLKIKIIKDNEFYEHFFRLVSHLLFLEKEHNVHYQNNIYSKRFAQVLADLRNEDIKILKEDNLTLEMIGNDFNFLQTYMLNIFKVTKNDLIISQEISVKIFEELAEINNAEVINVYQTETITNKKVNNFEQPEQASNDNDSELIESNINLAINNQKDDLAKALDPVQNLHTLKLPTHPAHNQGFYPYTTKSNLTPLLKNFLGYVFILLLLFTMAMSIYGFLTSIDNIEIVRTRNLGKIEKISLPPAGIGWNLSVWNIILEIFLYVVLIYVFFKKPQFLRDKYRVHPMLLLVSFSIIFFNSIYGTYGFLNANSFIQFFRNVFSEVNNYQEVLNQIWNDTYFQVYRILKLVGAGLALLPIILIFIIFSINPRLDRDKLMLADLEYQKALQAALKGEQYTIDVTLYDQDLILEAEKQEEQKKVHEL